MRPAQGGARADLRAAAGPGEHGLNDLLTAHLSRTCARLVGHGPEVVCAQAVVLDARGRVADLPETFAGNGAMSARGAVFGAGEPLAAVVARTHEALSPWLARPSAVLARRAQGDAWWRELRLEACGR